MRHVLRERAMRGMRRNGRLDRSVRSGQIDRSLLLSTDPQAMGIVRVRSASRGSDSGRSERGDQRLFTEAERSAESQKMMTHLMRDITLK